MLMMEAASRTVDNIYTILTLDHSYRQTFFTSNKPALPLNYIELILFHSMGRTMSFPDKMGVLSWHQLPLLAGSRKTIFRTN